MKSLSRARLFVTPWTVAHQAPPSMGFSRQEDWSGVPLPSPNENLLQPKKVKLGSQHTKNQLEMAHRPPDVKSQLTGKDPDAGKDWRQEEKGTTEDEMVGCITDSMNVSLSKLWEMVKDRKAWFLAFSPNWFLQSQRVGHNWVSWTEGFSSSHVWMWELDHKGGWAQKNWCFQVMVLEKTLENLLDCKEIQPVH